MRLGELKGELTLPQKIIHMVVPASLLLSVNSYLTEDYVSNSLYCR